MRNIIFLYIATAFTIFHACEKQLDEVRFTYSIASNTFYNTTEEANASVLAVLDQMRNTYSANWFSTLELQTEYCYGKGVYTLYNEHNGFENATHASRNAADWQNIYRAIMFSNTAINRLPDATEMDENEISVYLGELRFLRAYNYFQLVKHWGSVPLRTDENLTDWDLPKSSINEIYEFIINDLNFAVSHCPNSPRFIGTPGQNAAKGLLAEVYMFTKNYHEANRLSEEVILSGEYSLVGVQKTRDFDKIFGYDLTTSPEEVFYLKTSRTDGKTWSYLSFTSHPQYEIEPGKTMLNGFGYFTHYTDLRNEIISEWDSDDLRYDLNLGHYVFGEDAYGKYTCLLTKYWDPNASGSGANVSVPLIRYTDILFTFAESSARINNGPTEESIEILNMMRRRAYGHNPYDKNLDIDFNIDNYSDLNSFINLMVREDVYERMNEAKHYDLINRLGLVQELVSKYWGVDDKFQQFTEIQERHYLWKIPESEFNYNKALDEKVDQNPGY